MEYKIFRTKSNIYKKQWHTLTFLVVWQVRIIETIPLHNTFTCSEENIENKIIFQRN